MRRSPADPTKACQAGRRLRRITNVLIGGAAWNEPCPGTPAHAITFGNSERLLLCEKHFAAMARIIDVHPKRPKQVP